MKNILVEMSAIILLIMGIRFMMDYEGYVSDLGAVMLAAFVIVIRIRVKE